MCSSMRLARVEMVRDSLQKVVRHAFTLPKMN